jgi:hypothetical protein
MKTLPTREQQQREIKTQAGFLAALGQKSFVPPGGWNNPVAGIASPK